MPRTHGFRGLQHMASEDSCVWKRSHFSVAKQLACTDVFSPPWEATRESWASLTPACSCRVRRSSVCSISQLEHGCAAAVHSPKTVVPIQFFSEMQQHLCLT